MVYRLNPVWATVEAMMEAMMVAMAATVVGIMPAKPTSASAQRIREKSKARGVDFDGC